MKYHGCQYISFIMIVALTFIVSCTEDTQSNNENTATDTRDNMSLDPTSSTQSQDRQVDSLDPSFEHDMFHHTLDMNAAGSMDMNTPAISLDMGSFDMNGSDAQISRDLSVEPVMSTCPVSCAAFADCAIAQCPGYDEPDHELLVEGCMEVCTPALAGIFDALNECEDKLKFVGGIERSFQNFCDSSTDGFCETYLAVCDTWPNEAISCEMLYQTSSEERVDPTRGAHQVCYEYHLGAAMVAQREGHVENVRNYCLIAAGFAPCVD